MEAIAAPCLRKAIPGSHLWLLSVAVPWGSVRCTQRGNLAKISGFCGVAKKANAARKHSLVQDNIRFKIPKQEECYFNSKNSPLGL